MIETLRLYIRSTRQELWELKLVAPDQFGKNLFATDSTDFARMSPIFLAKLNSLTLVKDLKTSAVPVEQP